MGTNRYAANVSEGAAFLAMSDRQPLTRSEVANGLAAAIAMVVSYDSAQKFLESLAACMDAKERARAIAAGEVADLH